MTAILPFCSLCIWMYLMVAHGRFFSSRPQLPPALPAEFPEVDIIVPARDEAQTIGAAIGSLLAQDYPGKFRVILVDDHSSDNTGVLAGESPSLQVIRLVSKPEGWSGKLWALSQGLAVSHAPVVLLTDADIVHDPRHLASLVAHLLEARLDLVSEMVHLNCVSLAERSLVPAFVYFFQMLYPFARVNDTRSSTAAAAGGTILIRREALDRIGGIAAIKHALIDDVALAQAVKKTSGIFLGHSGLAASIRPYPAFADLWRMIARTAFTQLRFSAALLAITMVGLTVVWLVPPWFIAFGQGWEFVAGLCAYVLSALSYLPTLRRYRRSWLWVLALPLIAIFFMMATLGSAVNYWRGSGATWKDRAYTG
jgi:hopene-associated glycosyltransferase HpnB